MSYYNPLNPVIPTETRYIYSNRKEWYFKDDKNGNNEPLPYCSECLGTGTWEVHFGSSTYLNHCKVCNGSGKGKYNRK